MPCIANLDKRHCPICGDKYPGVFVACQLIKKIIYPRISSKCPLGCGRSFLTLDSHMSECEHREVACPICACNIKIDDIFSHLKSNCKFPWGDCDTTPPAQWDDAMISICANPGDTDDLGSIICMTKINPKNEHSVKKNDRVIYAWRENELVKLCCIQLSAAAGETQRIGYNSDQNEHVTCMVNSYASFPGAIEMPTTQFLELDISLGPGPWNLIIGSMYDVPTGDNNDPMLPDFIARNFRGIGTFRGKFLDVLWGPPRGVFVNHLGQTYMTNLDPQTVSEIKLANAAPSRYRGQFVTMPNTRHPSNVNPLFNAIRDTMMGLPTGRIVASGFISVPEPEVKVERESKTEHRSDEKNNDNGDDGDGDDGDDDDSSEDNASIPDLEMEAPTVPPAEQPITPTVLASVSSDDPIRVADLRRHAIVNDNNAEIAAFAAANDNSMRQLDDEIMDAAIAASLGFM
jgi:hypothetical protein